MMKTTVVFVRAAEFDPECHELTPLGDLQARRFAEAMSAKGLRFDRVMSAVHESDSWHTARLTKEETRSAPESFLKELALPTMAEPRGAEIARLIQRFPDQTISAYCGESEYQALGSHSLRALREIRKFISPDRHQQFLICSRYGHILSSLALHWVSEMVYEGFQICSHVGFPVGRQEVCYGATEFALQPGQGLIFKYDAADPSSRMVGTIQYLNPQA